MVLKCVGKKEDLHHAVGKTVYTVMMAAHNDALNRVMNHGIQVTKETFDSIKEGETYLMSFQGFNKDAQIETPAPLEQTNEESKEAAPVEPYTDDPVQDKAHSHDSDTAEKTMNPAKKTKK